MNTTNTHKTSTAASSGAPEIKQSRFPIKDGQSNCILTSKPTVGGAVPKGCEQRFEQASIHEAEFLRLPSVKGRCRFTGLSRSGLVSAAKAAGAFISVRLPGRIRGAVLIDKEKLTTFLRANAGIVKEGSNE